VPQLRCLAAPSCRNLISLPRSRPRRQHHDFRAHWHSLVKIYHILIDHPDAAGGNVLADGPWLERAVNAVERVLIALPQIHGAGTKRIARAAGHPKTTLQLGELPPKISLARDHLLWRIPVRPFLLVPDGRHTRPAEALTSHADAIADRPSATLDEIKKPVLRIDDDRSGVFADRVVDGLA